MSFRCPPCILMQLDRPSIVRTQVCFSRFALPCFWIPWCFQRTALMEIGQVKHADCTQTFWDEVENTSPNVPEVDHRHIDASKKAKFEQNFVAQLEFVAKVGLSHTLSIVKQDKIIHFTWSFQEKQKIDE